jgi:putative ABC transport system permease protein
MLRNIFRNRKNSLVILFLVGIITALSFLGNSILSQSQRGLQASYRENITADLVIQRDSGVSLSLFGANTPIIDEFFTLPVLPAHEAVYQIASSLPEAEVVTSQVTGNAVLDILGVREPVPLFGVEAATYFSAFPGIQLVEGRFLKSGEQGAMISAARAERIEKRKKTQVKMGEPLLFTTASASGFKIRELPLVGIFSYENPAQLLDELVFTDPQTVRALSSILLASDEPEPPEEASGLLSGEIDDLFGDVFETADEPAIADSGFSLDALKSRLVKEEESAESQDWRGGDWNFILIRLKEGASVGLVQNRLNSLLDGYGARAVGWRTAAGNTALLVLLVQALFNAGIALVGIAGMAAIVNILLISVFRRTREIGTLRAMGASDGYIRALVLGENLILSGMAGILGVLTGWAGLTYINRRGFSLENPILTTLLGGQIISVPFTLSVALSAVLVALGLGLLASLYPVETAVRIEPIVAVKRG